MTNQLQGTKVTKFDFICKVCRKIRQRPLAPKSQSVKFDKPIFYVQCPKENNICQGPFPLAFHLVCPNFAMVPTPIIISMQQREVIYGPSHFCVHDICSTEPSTKTCYWLCWFLCCLITVTLWVSPLNLYKTCTSSYLWGGNVLWLKCIFSEFQDLLTIESYSFSLPSK